MRLFTFVSLIVLALGCEARDPGPAPPPWATIPAVDGSARCEVGYTWPTACEYLWSSEAYAVATIAKAPVAVWEPAVFESDSSDERVIEERGYEECAVVFPTLRLELTIDQQLAGPLTLKGSAVVYLMPERLLMSPSLDFQSYPSEEPVWTDGKNYFEVGSKVLVPVFESANTESLIVTQPLLRVEEGVIVDPGAETCSPDDTVEFFGLKVDDLIALSSECSDSDLSADARDYDADYWARPANAPSPMASAQCDPALVLEDETSEAQP